MTGICDDDRAFDARLALLMFRGDEAGAEDLHREFVHAAAGVVGPAESVNLFEAPVSGIY